MKEQFWVRLIEIKGICKEGQIGLVKEIYWNREAGEFVYYVHLMNHDGDTHWFKKKHISRVKDKV